MTTTEPSADAGPDADCALATKWVQWATQLSDEDLLARYIVWASAVPQTETDQCKYEFAGGELDRRGL